MLAYPLTPAYETIETDATDTNTDTAPNLGAGVKRRDVGVKPGGVGVRRRGAAVVCGRCGENIQRQGCSCDVGRARGEAPRQGWVVVEKD